MHSASKRPSATDSPVRARHGRCGMNGGVRFFLAVLLCGVAARAQPSLVEDTFERRTLISAGQGWQVVSVFASIGLSATEVHRG
jgi:hypothetical protein